MKVYKYGDNVDTDVIIPARYLNAPDEKSLASHCMEDIDDQFASTVEPGDIIVANNNFGCGSSREHAPLAIRASGVKCVIAASLPVFSTATPLISVCPLWNALRLRPRFRRVIPSAWTFPLALSLTRPPERPIRLRPSRLLWKVSYPAVDCSNP